MVEFTEENGVSVPGQPKDVMSLPLEVVQGISTMFDVHPVDERVLSLGPTEEARGRERPNPVLIQDWVRGLGGR